MTKPYCQRCLGLDLAPKILREFAQQGEKFSWRSVSERLAEKGLLGGRPSGRAAEGPDYEETLLDKYLDGWEDLDDSFAREALIKFIQGEGIYEVVESASTYGAREELRRKISQALEGGGGTTIEAAQEIALELQDRGYLKLEGGRPLLTSSGVKILSREALGRALKKIGRRGAGVHEVEKLGLGGAIDPKTRPYEWGDEYSLIDIEETFYSALIRRGLSGQARAPVLPETLARSCGIARKSATGQALREGGSRTAPTLPRMEGSAGRASAPLLPVNGALSGKGKTSWIEPDDFKVHDTWHESRLLIGLLIDISGSMRSGGKLEAAIETSIALSELAACRPRDIVKMYTFSDTVEETVPAALLNRLKEGYTTDIARGLRAFRKYAAALQMEKLAYLITDVGANTEEGTFLGFARAQKGVLREVLKYRANRIELTMILLEQKRELVSFARQIASWSAGRLFITAPDKLTQLVISDFASRRGA